MLEREEGVYRVRVIDEETDQLVSTLSYHKDGKWTFFGNETEYVDVDIQEVDLKLDWSVPKSSYIIDAECPEAQNLVCLIDGVETKDVIKINLALQEITLSNFREQHRLYVDKQGNKTYSFGSEVSFHPREFKCYHKDSGEVYAEWNTYG